MDPRGQSQGFALVYRMARTHSAANLYDRAALNRLYQRNPSVIDPLLLRLRPSFQVR